MIPFIIITHGSLADSFVNSLKMIYGEIKDVFPCNFLRNMDLEELEHQVNQLVDSIESEKILIFTDMLGGSAFNTAMKVQREKNVHVITGVNMMMLLDLISIREKSDFSALLEHIKKNKEKYISVFEKKEV